MWVVLCSIVPSLTCITIPTLNSLTTSLRGAIHGIILHAIEQFNAFPPQALISSHASPMMDVYYIGGVVQYNNLIPSTRG